ncbi:MAG: hypothetical protein H6600_03385 [Flavobacteriales bacterium]|nr:hypothetical protein [Flavobacteriales bacterium]MCB9197475.1 hypothetical protein [Flavobacteriales bacterium]
MKTTKYLVIILLLITSNFYFSQDSGSFSLETQFDVFSKNNNAGNNLKFRYFINNTHVIRTNWGFDFNSNTNEILEVDGDGVGSIETINSLNNISLGYEYHMSQERFSPYLGCSFVGGFGKDEIYGSRTDGSVFINDFNFSQKQSISQFGIRFFTGFDFYIYKGLYCGSEIGYQIMNTKYKRGEIKTEDASSTTNASTSTPISEKKSLAVSLVNMGVIRVGWKF